MNLESREKINKFKCNIMNTDAVLKTFLKEKVRLPNALVNVKQNCKILTTVVNPNVIQKLIDFSEIEIEPFQNTCVNKIIIISKIMTIQKLQYYSEFRTLDVQYIWTTY